MEYRDLWENMKKIMKMQEEAALSVFIAS